MAYFGSPGPVFSFGSSNSGSDSLFSSSVPSFTFNTSPSTSTSPSPLTSTLSAPPSFPNSTPPFSVPFVGSLHNGNRTTAHNSSTTTGSASISTSKSAPDSAPQISTVPVMTLKLMIEKKMNRVVFSESNKDFIDLLFSFLTLPIGTIIRLLEDKSPPTVIGCMNQLYKSVENLDTQLFITEACKKMLLQLTRLPEVQCKNLKAAIEKNLEPSKCFYFCSNSDCRTGGKGILSDFPNVRCHCGQVLNQLATLTETNSHKGNGGFVKRRVEQFLVSGDFKVMPGSTSPTLTLLKDLNIVDANELESRSLILGPIEILQLLRLSLVSKTPLKHWMHLKQGITFLNELEAKDFGELLDIKPANSESKKMDLKLFVSKCRNEVLYAESGEDFVDFLFSFLTFPLGSIIKLLGGKSSLGCVDNLYSSVQNFSTDNYLQSEEVERMLLSPKLAPFSACESQLLDIEESVNPQYMVDSCWEQNIEWFVRPVIADSNCNSFEGKLSGPLSLVNPKSSAGETTGGGGFVKGPVKFMVTGALAVTLLSPTSITSYLADLNVPITDVCEKVVSVGENEALNLLKMALVSGKALTNVFNLGDGQSVSESE
ncbi:hypothetical protein Vadar_026007 [Vaccinium darrowii]|uniref:Uncharacterized protein n=1 Tax=Vaccinium darrowii TaxID=229202 RepID=A0ACB7YQA6_9ERIC|nr:hypothetical protein Vadar_026007 [Vaccinium darrowii]